MAQLCIQELSFTYPGSEHPALQDVSLFLPSGSFTVLCGASGSGKTTLLRQLKPALAPHGRQQGRILIDSIPLQQLSPLQQAGDIGYVMQNPDEQIVTDKVWHELCFGLENLGVPESLMRLRVAEIAAYFGMERWFHRDTATLSGGQKQLLNLAAVMAMQPKILLLDEPTSQLDPIAASAFFSAVERIHRELGTTILLSEHRLEDVLPYADTCVVLSEGTVRYCDSPRRIGEALRDTPEVLPVPLQIFYGAGGTGDAPLHTAQVQQFLSRCAEGKILPPLPPEPSVTGTPAITVKDLWVRYRRNAPDVLQGLSLSVPRGCLHAIVGGNGAGKSTLLQALSGSVHPYRGKIQLDGRCAYLPQDPISLFSHKTAAEELQEMRQDSDTMGRIIRLCRLQHLLDRHPYDLSGGEQQRLALGKVLLAQPQLLLLDEPTRGMDAAFKVQFAALLQQLCQVGITVILVSHDVEFCARYAHLVSLLFDGQILTTDTPRRFFSRNSFYTTAASRMSRHLVPDAVTAAQVLSLIQEAPQ